MAFEARFVLEGEVVGEVVGEDFLVVLFDVEAGAVDTQKEAD